VACRRMTDHIRSEVARRKREQAAAEEAERLAVPLEVTESEEDDTLVLLFMCCHPALTPASAIALTLRAVGGLTTAEIANAFLVPEATMAQRISRAKQSIKESGIPFEKAISDQRPAISDQVAGGSRDAAERLGEGVAFGESGSRAPALQGLRSVMHVLYLMFNEGYASSAGARVLRTDLSDEAIRLMRIVYAREKENTEVAGLLALMLLTDARREARTGPNGELIPLAQQDRGLWDRQKIAEGVGLLSAALPKGSVGPYQLQAAIAAVHDEAARAEETDWAQILALYELLKRMSDNPMVLLNHAVAAAMVQGARKGLELLAELDGDARLTERHRLEAVRGHLLEMAGEDEAAIACYCGAGQRATSGPEREYLFLQAARLREGASRRRK
jgi:predicted RNA polymerase sigma factor